MSVSLFFFFPVQVVDYCENTACRHVFIARHFGEKGTPAELCGRMCDFCQGMSARLCCIAARYACTMCSTVLCAGYVESGPGRTGALAQGCPVKHDLTNGETSVQALLTVAILFLPRTQTRLPRGSWCSNTRS